MDSGYGKHTSIRELFILTQYICCHSVREEISPTKRIFSGKHAAKRAYKAPAISKATTMRPDLYFCDLRKTKKPSESESVLQATLETGIMPGKTIRPQCGCEFRACGTTPMTDSNPIADMWISAYCGCMFYPCGTILVGAPAPIESIAAQGGGANDPLAAQFPVSSIRQRGRPPVPQAPPPAPRPAFAQLAPRGRKGHGRAPAEGEFVDPISLRMPMTAGGVNQRPGNKLLAKNDVSVVHENPRQKRAGRSTHPSSVADTGSSYRGAHWQRKRREDAANDELAWSGQLETNEVSPDFDLSKNRPNRRVGEPCDFSGMNTQNRSPTLGSFDSERCHVRFAPTSDGMPRRKGRPADKSRRNAPRGPARATDVNRNAARDPKWQEVRDEVEKLDLGTEDPVAPCMDVVEDYALASLSSDSTEAHHKSFPRPQHSLRGGMRREGRHFGGLGPQIKTTWDVPHLSEEGFEPARPVPAVPVNRDPSTPFRERIRAQRSLQSRPSDRRGGKQPEKHIRKTATAPKEEAYPQESDDSYDAYSPKLGEPGPSSGRGGREKVRDDNDDEVKKYSNRGRRSSNFVACTHDGRRPRNNSPSSAAEPSKGRVAHFRELDMNDDLPLLDDAWKDDVKRDLADAVAWN
ncbi:hypothetical protein MMC17_004524 [Xylographa soralifera]|nr:hypothetical protein [Xylographa soralifera]